MWNLFERRLGMFVHWGVYSVGGVHEQEWMRRGMKLGLYYFNPEWHTPEYLKGAIARVRDKGWNFLLNVGPKPDGTIPDEALALLRRE